MAEPKSHQERATVYVCGSLMVHLCVDARVHVGIVPSNLFFFFFFTVALPDWSVLAKLTSKSQRSTCISLLSIGIPRAAHTLNPLVSASPPGIKMSPHQGFLCGFWGLNPGTHDFMVITLWTEVTSSGSPLP